MAMGSHGVQLRSLTQVREVTEIMHGGVEHTSTISRDSGEFNTVIGSSFVFPGRNSNQDKNVSKVDAQSSVPIKSVGFEDRTENISGFDETDEPTFPLTDQERLGPEGSSPTQSDSGSPESKRVYYGDPNADDILPVSLADFVMKSIVERRESMNNPEKSKTYEESVKHEDENESDAFTFDTLTTAVSDEDIGSEPSGGITDQFGITANIDDVTVRRDSIDDVTSRRDNIDDVTVRRDSIDDITSRRDSIDDITVRRDSIDDITVRRDSIDDVTGIGVESHHIAYEAGSLNSDDTLDITCESPSYLENGTSHGNNQMDSSAKRERRVHFDMNPVHINPETLAAQYKKSGIKLNQSKNYKSKLEKWPKSDTYTSLSVNLKGSSIKDNSASSLHQLDSHNNQEYHANQRHSALDLGATGKKDLYKNRFQWYCCCGFGWFMVGLVALAGGAVLVAYLRPYWEATGEMTLDRKLLYFGAALCILGGICVLVSMGFWTKTCLVLDPRTPRRSEKRQVASKYTVETETPGSSKTNGYVQNGSTAASPPDLVTAPGIHYVECVEYKEAERNAAQSAKEDVFLM